MAARLQEATSEVEGAIRGLSQDEVYPPLRERLRKLRADLAWLTRESERLHARVHSKVQSLDERI